MKYMNPARITSHFVSRCASAERVERHAHVDLKCALPILLSQKLRIKNGFFSPRTSNTAGTRFFRTGGRSLLMVYLELSCVSVDGMSIQLMSP